MIVKAGICTVVNFASLGVSGLLTIQHKHKSRMLAAVTIRNSTKYMIQNTY